MKTLQTTALDVEGMTCGSCARHVEGALRAVPGVVAVDVRLRERRALVRRDATAATTDELLDALAECGYPARLERE